MATINSVGVGLLGATGSGNFVGSTSPAFVTPNIGVATATTLAFSPTTSGIIGTPTNDNAAAGIVGEYISSSVLIGSAVSLVANTTKNVTSISLTAGDWYVTGTVYFSPGALTGILVILCSISLTSNTFASLGTENNVSFFGVNMTTGGVQGLYVGPTRIRLSATTTVYLVADSNFNTSTMSVYGFIGARRAR